MRGSFAIVIACAVGALAGCYGVSEGTLTDGQPSGDDAGTTGDDAGSSSAGGDNPYDTPVTCTSGTSWTRGNRGSSSMHPGDACIACHQTTGGEAPSFTVAGTVYPSAHEPNDCNGASGAKVVITDSKGQTLTLTTNAAGSFAQSNSTFTPPYHAKVTYDGKERAMSAAQTSGDCNGCHTETGANGAPGRIMLP